MPGRHPHTEDWLKLDIEVWSLCWKSNLRMIWSLRQQELTKSDRGEIHGLTLAHSLVYRQRDVRRSGQSGGGDPRIVLVQARSVSGGWSVLLWKKVLLMRHI
jgi:hypothetical protein